MRFLVLTLALVAAVAPGARGAHFSFSSTPDGSGSPCSEPPTSFPALMTLYVGVSNSGLPGGGITGAEFSLTGFDALAGNYLVASTTNPAANITIGNPLLGGVNIAFPTCQTSNFVWLYSFQIINLGDTELHQLGVAARQPPANPTLACQRVVLCDAPVFTAMCVGSGTASLNILREPPAPSTPQPAAGATGVPLDLTLRWYVPPIQAEECAAGAISQEIFFGTDANPPHVAYETSPRWYVLPQVLLPNTRYYWRVVAGVNSSPVWSFTTGSDVGVSVQPATWTQVRSLYR
jgi:hypothetical protein